MKAIDCPCGEVMQAETDAGLLDAVKSHFAEVHPQMAGKYTDEQMLSVARNA